MATQSDKGNALAAAPWHALPVDTVLNQLDSTQQGLSRDEAAQRLTHYGPNVLPRERPLHPLLRFLKQFHDVLIYVLIAAALLTALLGEWTDMGVILAVVLINAIISFIQEGKAEAALTAIRTMLALEATVLRNHKRQRLAAEMLVPGDIVILESGDRVPADLRLISIYNGRVDEAILTGESEPVNKQISEVSTQATLADRLDMAYSGTIVTSGRLTGVVVATGSATELGRIGRMVSQVEKLTTPLLKAIRRFGVILSVTILSVALALFVFGVLVRAIPVPEMFLIVVSLAVAAIPEGLPAIITITLALGVERMARQKAIVRRLPAVETLGAVTVICSDKTGTLTKNEMVVKEVRLADTRYTLTAPDPRAASLVTAEAEVVAVQTHPTLLELIRTGILCSDTSLQQDPSGNWQVSGDPTEVAVVQLGLVSDIDVNHMLQAYPRLDVIPFESEHRFMLTLHGSPTHNLLLLKGAPEVVLTRCQTEQLANGTKHPLIWETWHQRVETLAAEGYRVLAFAAKATERSSISPDDSERGFTLLGCVGMIDPPRPEAIEAVRECHQAGIRVKMITGDHAITARAIGAQLGIGNTQHVLTGPDLETMNDSVLRRVVMTYDIFARSSPEHKLRLVQALQANGEVTAMTGDGVNDAPALKRANVGVAMGVKGSEAAKSVAEIVLADDNFATIRHAVEEGRTIYDNLKKTILFILPTNGAEAVVIVATVLLALGELPITPVQILWINMITAVTLALALAFEPGESEIMRRPPRDPHAPILSRQLIWRISFVSVLTAGLTLTLFLIQLARELPLATARTIAVNTLVASEAFYLFNCRFVHQTSLSLRGLTKNRVAILAVGLLTLSQLLLTYFPPLQNWFGTAPLAAGDWLWVLGAGLTVFVLVELEKLILRKLAFKRNTQRISSPPIS